MKKFSWNVFAIKITSRKFWIALAGLAASVMAFANCDENTIVQATAIIGALGSVVGYLIANGLTDDAGTAATETGNTGSGDVSIANPTAASATATSDMGNTILGDTTADNAPVVVATSAPQIPQDGLVQSVVAADESATTVSADASTVEQATVASQAEADSADPVAVATVADANTK